MGWGSEQAWRTLTEIPAQYGKERFTKVSGRVAIQYQTFGEITGALAEIDFEVSGADSVRERPSMPQEGRRRRGAGVQKIAVCLQVFYTPQNIRLFA